MRSTFKPLSLPHSSSTLPNGLRVVVHEDTTSPIVAVHLMYHAGSKDERVGRTGLAHLLEHLLFEGSENCPKGEFDRLLERVGGTNNGSTWLDRTNYYEVVPSHAVELALWLERERMGHFLPVLDSEMLDVQRSVVINERKQVYENRPYGLAHEKLHELLFPPDHPYSWPTIGYTPDLEAMTLEDARDFYSRYYAPDNAVLVLAGDVSESEGFELANRYFGDLQASGVRERAATNGHVAEGRATELEDRVSFPRIYYAYAVPPFGTNEWIHLDVLSYLLADGESSRLQRSLIRDHELAQDVDTYLHPTELAGIFGIEATARSGVGPDRLRVAVDEVVEQIADGGVTDAEVVGAIRRVRRDHLNSLANVEERAEELAYASTVLSSAGRLEELLNAYATVEAEDVQRVAQTYLGVENRATVVVVPGGEDEPIG
ncbi:MAG: insulinase family protein [Gemmatimonas sp.]|nr:insulinase family protein [Gemmatimonas sp.]